MAGVREPKVIAHQINNQSASKGTCDLGRVAIVIRKRCLTIPDTLRRGAKLNLVRLLVISTLEKSDGTPASFGGGHRAARAVRSTAA